MRLFSYAMLFTAVAIAAPAAAADKWDPCAVDQADVERQTFPRLVGNWTVKNGKGHAVLKGKGGSMAVPLKPEPDASLDFILDGEAKLRAVNWTDMSSDEINFNALVGNTILDEAIKFIGKGGVSEEDLATTVGCLPDDLPKISADGVRADKEGQMKWEAHFIVAGENLLVGAMSFNLRPSDDPSGLIKGYRLVTLTR